MKIIIFKILVTFTQVIKCIQNSINIFLKLVVFFILLMHLTDFKSKYMYIEGIPSEYRWWMSTDMKEKCIKWMEAIDYMISNRQINFYALDHLKRHSWFNWQEMNHILLDLIVSLYWLLCNHWTGYQKTISELFLKKCPGMACVTFTFFEINY